MVKFSDRLGKLAPYPFVEISRIIAEKRAAGADVVTFGIGDPDIPTPQPIIDRLLTASQHAPNHRYPETDGLPEMRRAFAQWYDTRFSVKLDPDTEVLPLIGAKEGIGHAAFCFLDPGDIALIPDPAYPVYGVGTMFAGAEGYVMPLYEKNGWLPELDAIPSDVARAAKLMWLNYPNNPTSAVASEEDFLSAIAFCKENDIALLRIKANLDSGVPQAVQEMAMEALTGPQDCVADNVDAYTRRRDRVVKAVQAMGMNTAIPRASLYIWARVPDGYTSAEMAQLLLEELDVVVTPGSSYGKYGEGYIRLSLTTPDEQIEKGCQRMETWKIPPPKGS